MEHDNDDPAEVPQELGHPPAFRGIQHLSSGLRERATFRRCVRERSLNVVSCICSYMDLCGFGTALCKDKWDLAEAQAGGLIEALSFFHDSGALAVQCWGLNERVLVLNDGIARIVDLSQGASLLDLAAYVCDLVMTHRWVLHNLAEVGLSLRTVMAGGHRVQYAPHSEPGGQRADPQVYNPLHFQMNTAFSRAYLIEQSGSAQGIRCGRIYVDRDWLDAVQGLGLGTGAVEVSHDCSGGSGVIRFGSTHAQWLELLYDEVLRPAVDKLGSGTTLFQLRSVRQYAALGDRDGSFSLVPDEIEDEIREEKAESGWPV